jgi:ATP-dependent RNA helicase RhlE
MRDLEKSGLRAAAIHGNKSQNQRERSLEAFKSQHPPVLIATDIAARGIDVDNVTHVVNFDLPHEPETYVHRIGRTGRAGMTGAAFSFCDREERGSLRDIERLLRKQVPVLPLPEGFAADAADDLPAQSGGGDGRRQGRHEQRRGGGGRRQGTIVGGEGRSQHQGGAKHKKFGKSKRRSESREPALAGTPASGPAAPKFFKKKHRRAL